jgi:hypothetical protein
MMAKKRTKLERNLQSAPRHRKRQPYGVPLERKAKSLVHVAAIVNPRKHKNEGE